MPRVVGGQHKVYADLLELYVRSRAKEDEMKREDWTELLDITMPKLEHLRPLLEIREFTRLAYVMALVGSERDAPLASRAVVAMLVTHWRDREPCKLLQKDATRHATVTSVELTEDSTPASIAQQLRHGVRNALDGVGLEPMGMVQQWGEDCILITGGRGGIEAEVDDLALRCEEAGNSSAALEVLQAYVKQKRMDTFVQDFLTWGKDQLKRLPPTMLDGVPKREPSRAQARPLTDGESLLTEEENSRGAWALLPACQQKQQKNGGATRIMDDRAAASNEEQELSGGSSRGRGADVTARANKRTPSPSLVASPPLSAYDYGAWPAFLVPRGADNPPPPVQSLDARGAPAADTGASLGARSGLGAAGGRGTGDEDGRPCSPRRRRSFDQSGAKRGRKGAVRSVDDPTLDRSVVCSPEPEGDGDGDVGKEAIPCSMSPGKKGPASTGKNRDVGAALQAGEQDAQCRRSPRKTTGRQGELLKNDQVLYSMKVAGKSTSWTPGVVAASHQDGKYDVLLASGERARFVGRADLHPRKGASAAPAGCPAEIFRRPTVVNSDPQSGSSGILRLSEDTPARTLHPIRRAGIRKPADVECGKVTQHVQKRKKQEQADIPGKEMEMEDTRGREESDGGGGVEGIRGSDRETPKAGDTPRRSRGRPLKRPRDEGNSARVANIDNGHAGAGGASSASSSITGENNWEAASLAKSGVSRLSPGYPVARRGRYAMVDRGCGRAAGNSPLLVQTPPGKRRRSKRAHWDRVEYGGGVDGGQEQDGENGSAGSVVPSREEIAAHLESSGGRGIEKDDSDSSTSEEDVRSPRKRRSKQRNG